MASLDEMLSSLNEMVTQQPTVAYTGVIIFLLWLASFFNCASFWLFVIMFLFLFEIDRNYTRKLRREIRSEERRSARQSRPLSDFESVEWINQAVEKLWPCFLEKFISQDILKPMVPWFLDKHKPWTVRKAILQRLELGKNPPKFSGIRTLQRTSGDDHLVMDMCLDFAAAEDMIAVLSVQMRKRLGLGIRTNVHISRLHIEGKIRVGVKFSNKGLYISRVCACFENAPKVQMTARPLFTHGVNVSEVPLIAGWMERMVADVFEQSLVEPNMLVLDMGKLVSSLCNWKTSESSIPEKWFDVKERPPIAILHLQIIEALDLKPSDPNGLADPFVRGSFTTRRFETKVIRKTLTPRWSEEFEVPIASWELPTLLVLHVRDKDQFHDDDLGYCEIDIKKYRGGSQHDLWLPLHSIKMGRLHVSLKITEDDTGSFRKDSLSKGSEPTKQPNRGTNDADEQIPVEEKYEVINLGNGNEGYLSVVSPGQPFRGKQQDTVESVNSESSTSDDASEELRKAKPRRKKIWGRMSHQRPSLDIHKPDPPSPENGNEYVAVGTKGTTVRMKLEDPCVSTGATDLNDEQAFENPTSPPLEFNDSCRSPSRKDHMKIVAKNFVKHAGKTAHNFSTALHGKGSGKRKMENEDGGSESRLADEKAVEVRESGEQGQKVAVSDGTSESLEHKSLNGSGL